MPSARSIAFRREVFEAAGGYPEWLAVGEDMYLNHRMLSGGAHMERALDAVTYWRVRPTVGQRLLILLCRLFRPRKLFPIPLSDPDLFTANPNWQAFLRDDPLRLHQATARLLFESVRLDGYLRFVPKYVHVPVLMLLAEHDPFKSIA